MASVNLGSFGLVQSFGGLGSRALDEARRLSDNGLDLLNQGENKEALLCLMQAHEIYEILFEHPTEEMAKNLANLGAALRNLGNFDDAWPFQMDAVDQYKALFVEEATEEMGKLYNDCLGRLVNSPMNLNKFKEALNRLYEAYKLNQETVFEDQNITGMTFDSLVLVTEYLVNEGVRLSNNKFYEETLACLEDPLLEVAKTIPELQALVPQILLNIGESFTSLNRFEEAGDAVLEACDWLKDYF